MAIAIGELQQMTIAMLQNGQTVENVIMMRERTGLSTQDDLRAAVRLFWTKYRAVICDDVTVLELRIKEMTPVPLDTLIFQPTAGQEAGAAGGDTTNSMLAVVTTHRTGTAGKRHRGRSYTPGVAAGMTADNQNRLSSTWVTNYQTMWDDILTEFGDASGGNATLAFGIYSRLIGGTAPYTVAGWQAVTQCVPHVILGTQRRRRIGVGI